MGCNCSGNKAAKYEYVHTANGATRVYQTQVEAQAAVYRHGGTWEARQK